MFIFIKEIFRKKETKYYFLIFLSFFLLFILMLNFYNKVVSNISIKENYYTNRELRIISKDSLDVIKEKTLHIANIDSIYTYDIINGKINDNNVFIQTYIPQKNIELIIGKQITNSNEIILSSKYKDYYNQDVTIIIDNNEYKMKVVGIFSDEKISDIVFILDSSEIKDSVLKNNYNILVNETKNVDKVAQSLSKSGYYANVFDNSNNIYKLELIKKLLTIIITILVILIVLLNFLIFRGIILENIKEIAILKSIGYYTNKILMIILIQNMIISFCSFCTSLIIFVFSYNIINIKINYASIFLLLIIIFLTFIFNIILLRKKIDRINSTVLYNINY